MSAKTDAEFLAHVDVMGALVFAMIRRLDADGQRAFYADLMTMRQAKIDAGDTTSSKILEDLCRACLLAAPAAFRH